MNPVDAVAVFSFHRDRQSLRALAFSSALRVFSGLKYSCVLSFRNSLLSLEYISPPF
jgi:hypothetical protein